MHKRVVQGPSLGDASRKPIPAGIEEHRITVTFFKNEFARFREQEDLTLPEIKERMEGTTRRSKEKLPYLKLATFGDLRSSEDCLRHDANVETISGIEFDYDDEEVSFEDGVARLEASGIRGLVTTTASHREAAPRWRLYLPLATELVPPDDEPDPIGWLRERRRTLVRQVNAVFGGIFARESETMSQSFYFGSVAGKEPIRIEVEDGAFVDTVALPDVPAEHRPPRGQRRVKNVEPADLAEVERALGVITKDDYDTWLKVGAALHDEFGDDGFDMFDRWSARSPKYDTAKVRRKWGDAEQMTEYSIGTVFRLANEASPGWRSQTTVRADGHTILDPTDPMRSARAMYESQYLTADGKNTLVRHRGEFFKWSGACYQINAEEAQRGEIWRYLDKSKIAAKDGRLVPFKPKKDNISNVHEALGAICAVDDYVEPPAWIGNEAPIAPPREFFAASNGLLHLPTRTLHDPTPSYFGVTASSVAYDPDAGPPTQWLAYLLETVADEEAIGALQEWMGYTLGGDTSQQKILFCIGPRRSGKGTFARVHTALLGKNSVGGPTMSSFGTNFGLAPLITKSLAIVSDARIGKKTDRAAITERLLTISGEDTIDIDRKYGTMWTGRLPTRIAILTNELPAFSEGSGALAGRFLVILFQHSFFGREDPGLTDRLMGELPGILNWAIAGYERLQSRGHFVQAANALEQIESIERLGNPVKAFVLDRCVVGPAREIEVDVLFEDWRVWCTEHGGDAGNKDWFGRNLRSAVPGLSSARREVDGRRVMVYRGVDIETPDHMGTAGYRLTQRARSSGGS
jgi:P4 family phage/plasmid primase-like protien